MECQVEISGYFGFPPAFPTWWADGPVPFDQWRWQRCQGLGRGLAGGVLKSCSQSDSQGFHWIPWDCDASIQLYDLVCGTTMYTSYAHCMVDMFLFRYVSIWNKGRPIIHHTLATPTCMARFADRPFTSRWDDSCALKGWDIAGLWRCFWCCLFC